MKKFGVENRVLLAQLLNKKNIAILAYQNLF
jgi:hypothetical protein